MSAREQERLEIDLRRDAELLGAFQELESDPDAWSRWATACGYQVSPQEVEALAEIHGELSDEDLEQAAGGWTEPPPPGSGG